MARYQVCAENDIPVGEMKEFKVNRESVLVYHLEDGFYATQSRCTHLFGPLQNGKIVDGNKIQCPWHHSCFDICTGAVIEWANYPPGIQLLNIVRNEKALKTYKVTVENGKLFVDI
jgi:3-phenylpropionate/trans-cinnamate dioxygenase ferredoxin subunit